MALAPSLDTELSRLFAHYKNDMLSIRHLHESDENPREIVREITDVTDTLIICLLLEFLKKNLDQDDLPNHILLLAQGGYGRRELHPQSDIDLLFLHSSPLTDEEQNVIKEFYRTLYDMGFKVGHTCRSVEEAIEQASCDTHSQTAMLESRFLAGDWRTFESFKHDLWNSIKRNRMELIRQKIAERKERVARYGHTINISEPNIKESLGGLRDYHFGLWIGSLHRCCTLNLINLKRSHFIDDQLMSRVEEAITFLWRLRNDLHFMTGKEQDILLMPLQHELSLRLGYQDRRGRLAEEAMMREYYQHALSLSNFAERMIKKCSPVSFWTRLKLKSKKPLSDGFYLRNGEIHIPPDLHFFEHYPQRLLMAFVHAAEQKARLAEETVAAIHDNHDLIDQAFLHDKDNAALLRKFFNIPHGIDVAVQEMRETGVLEQIVPEWRGITNLIRYDLVHRYTVDEHSFLSLYHLEHLYDDTLNFSQERFLLWWNSKDKDVLRLAILCHDIGKGRHGDHSIIGAGLVDDISRRMRLTERKRKQLVFLVKNHLMMSRTAQHRDLADPQVVADFSDAFDRVEDLDMMYLLTYVDMRSVSPESMTEWKNNLLWQLYLACRETFISETPTSEQTREHEISRKEKLINELTSEFNRQLLQTHFDRLPPSYMMNQPVETIRRHLKAIQEYDGSRIIAHFYPHMDSACLEIVLVTHDRVGLFSQICTAVMLENFSIEEARLNTRSDGLVVNNICIRNVLEDSLINKSREQLLLDRLERVLNTDGKLPRVPKVPGTPILGRTSFENKVRLLNDISAKFTVLEIRCPDRRGLLQDITSTLADKKINIYFARIITEGNRATDVFYIANYEGEKIQDDSAVQELTKDLKSVLETSDNYAKS